MVAKRSRYRDERVRGRRAGQTLRFGGVLADGVLNLRFAMFSVLSEIRLEFR